VVATCQPNLRDPDEAETSSWLPLSASKPHGPGANFSDHARSLHRSPFNFRLRKGGFCRVALEGRSAISVLYRNNILNVLDEARLFVRELRGNVILPGENFYYRQRPLELSETEYGPDVAPGFGWCWLSGQEKLISSEELANAAIDQFFRPVDRHSLGKLPDPD